MSEAGGYTRRIFTLTFKLDNAEAAELGEDTAVPEYLIETADKIRRNGAASGVVMDGNGNRIGTWRTEDVWETADDE